MKKIISIISALALCVTLTACNTAVENESVVIEKRSPEGSEPVGSTDYTVKLISTLEELEARSDLIVIGDFIDNPKTCYNTPSMRAFSCPMRITKVLAGDAQVGDVMPIFQLELIEDDRVVAHSKLTPMQMGDEWLFCLNHVNNMYGDGYVCVEDNKGRYPTKNSCSNEVVCFSDHPELGVYEESDFQEELYNQLLEKYGEF